MTPLRLACAACLSLALVACETTSPPTARPPPREPVVRDFPTTPEVRDSVYLPVDRATPARAGYGLYTVLLTRTADRKTMQLLSDLFATAVGADQAAIQRENLNLIMIPVTSAPEATRALASARSQPDVAATAVMHRFYDFGRAAQLMASVCHPNRGAAVMKACGSSAPDGPLLVSTQHPLDGAAAPGQRMLIVNLSTTPPEAVREVLAAYRRQIVRKDFADQPALDEWRLLALNYILDAAKLLPGISKAYAGSK